MIQKLLRGRWLAAVFVLAAACSDGVQPAPPPSLTLTPQNRSIRVGESFEITANLIDPAGNLDATSIVWSSLNGEIASVTASGVVLGIRPGDAEIVASVSGAADTMRVQVVQTAGEIAIDSLPALRTGDEVQLRARVLDTEGEEMEIAVAWRAEPGSLASIDTAGVLTALGAGEILITASVHPVTATMRATIDPALPPPGCETASTALAVGETRSYDGGTPLNLCLSGNARYALVVANPASGSVRTEFRGADLSSIAPGVTPALIPEQQSTRLAIPALLPDRDFERRLRRREREELSLRAARGPLFSRSASLSATQQAVGDLVTLTTGAVCDEFESTAGRIEYVGEHAIVVADTANPAGMTREHFERFGVLFDTLLHPVVTESFGEPAGLNGEQRITIFFTRAVNELTESDSRGYVGGYFWAGDLFAETVCASSNEREMFYMLAADPDGTINDNPRSVDFVLRVSASTIAHELQHLINASRRMFVNDAETFETAWLDEGLAHIAEEMVYYHQSGYGPGQNLAIGDLTPTQHQVDAANDYAVANLLRLDSYLRDVERQGPFQTDDDLETRGAIWQFLRYTLDRHSGDDRTALRALVDARNAGLPNLRAVFGIEPADWFVDASVALFADDATGGLAARHIHPSWNFRSVLAALNEDGFVIENRTLTDGQVLSVGLEGWGTGYVRFRVGSGRVGSVRIGTPEAPPASQLRLVLIRTQ